MRFVGKSVVITGATGGLGRAAAKRFHDEGANIALVDLHQNDIDAFLQTFETDSIAYSELKLMCQKMLMSKTMSMKR